MTDELLSLAALGANCNVGRQEGDQPLKKNHTAMLLCYEFMPSMETAGIEETHVLAATTTALFSCHDTAWLS